MTRASPEHETPELLRLAAEGDADAWRSLIDEYTPRLFGLLMRQCGDRDLAEELTQATFVKLLVKLRERDAYTEQGQFDAWLFRIALNALRDEMRRRKRHATPMDMSPANTPDATPNAWAGLEPTVRALGSPHASIHNFAPDHHALHAEALQQLEDAVAQLPDADREVLHLRHTAGLSFAEIAETLDQPLGTVLARAHRALAKLRKIMQPTDAGWTSAQPSQ